MTGIEVLNQRLIEAGCTPSQTKAKVIDVLLEVLCKDSGLLDQAAIEWKAALSFEQDELDKRAKALQRRENEFNYNGSGAVLRQREHDLLVRETKVAKREQAVKEVEEQLLQFETPIMRDRYKAAVYFKKHIEVNTKYDNTAHIRGLAAILSGSEQGDGET